MSRGYDFFSLTKEKFCKVLLSVPVLYSIGTIKTKEGGFGVEDSQIIELYWQKNTDAIKETDIKYGAYCFAVANNILQNKEKRE